MVSRKRVLAIPETSIFLRRDVTILRRRFEVRTASFDLTKIRREPLTGIFSVIRDIFAILRGTLWADLTFSHFADIQAFLAVLFSKMCRKKSVVVIGGFEVAHVPEIRYGAMLNPILSRIVKFVLRHADKIMAVSEFNRTEILKYVNRRDIKVVYGVNAVDCNNFRASGEKKDMVMTTAFIHRPSVKRKGLGTFVEAAKYLPKIRFVVAGSFIGKPRDDTLTYLRSLAPENVEFVDDNDLLSLYQEAKVYCQLSYYESLGVSLAEAMACECVPVVTDRASLPEVVGDTGFYVRYGDVGTTAKAIKAALSSDKGGKARNRIKNLLSIDKTEFEFVAEINKLVE